MKKMTIIINASNLHVGGGLQVAASVIDEMSKFEQLPKSLKIIASKDVDNNLKKNNGFERQLNYEVIDSYGLNQLLPLNSKHFTKCKSVFTIFGPLYLLRPNFKNIVGFAQPWIIYPDNECYRRVTFLSRIILRFKFWIQGLFFKSADLLVVDLEHVKEGLIKQLGINPDRIKVIHSCISSLYLDNSLWQKVNIPSTEGLLRLGFLGRNYLHKNTIIFPDVVKKLKYKYGINAVIFVTFNEQEWTKTSHEFKSTCINVGPLSVFQCPSFYESMDAVIFPSLLETFSATPFEAFVMKKPLFASDRNFNRDICGEHAIYFDPLSPGDAATKIASFFSGKGPDPILLKEARDHAINFSNPKERAQKYLDLLTNG